MDERRIGSPARVAWLIDEIPFRDVDRDLVRDDQQLFYGVVAASFIEITADLHTANLAEFYRGDDEATEWLSQQWEPEELQHGATLKRYVESAWPDFDWNTAYRPFFAQYSRCCGVDVLATTRELEFAARCVVEIGTATFYPALSDMTGEPVLKQIAGLIAADEYAITSTSTVSSGAITSASRRAGLSSPAHCGGA